MQNQMKLKKETLTIHLQGKDSSKISPPNREAAGRRRGRRKRRRRRRPFRSQQGSLGDDDEDEEDGNEADAEDEDEDEDKEEPGRKKFKLNQ